MSAVMILHRPWLFLLCLSMVLFSCKKEDKKNPISFTIKSTIPYDGTPIPGVKYTVREYKGGLDGIFSEPNYTDWEITGVTDASGLAQVNFKPKKNTKYQYEIVFDYSGIQLPAGINDVQLVNAPSYDYIPKDGYQKEYDIRVLPYLDVTINFKNMNCIDNNDVFRYRQFNKDEKPYYSFQQITNWLEGPELNGCVNLNGSPYSRLAGHYLFQWEAIRGGVLTTGIDTFFVAPGVNNQINMFW